MSSLLTRNIQSRYEQKNMTDAASPHDGRLRSGRSGISAARQPAASESARIRDDRYVVSTPTPWASATARATNELTRMISAAEVAPARPRYRMQRRKITGQTR